MSRRRVVVVGGGISGLTAAHELRRGGRDVLVIEAADRVGGVVQTKHAADCTFESGPSSFPDSAAEIFELAQQLGIEDRIINATDAAKTRLIYHRHRLLPVPMNPRDIRDSEIFTSREKARFLLERFIPKRRRDRPESVAHFFYRRFGKASARTLVDAFVSGIYCGDARHIGLRSAFPVLHHMEQKYGSITKAFRVRKKANKPFAMNLHSFEGGLSELMISLAKGLGDGVWSNSAVKAVAPDGTGFKLNVERKGGLEEIRADQIVIAAPAPVAGLLLAPFHPMVSDLLFDVDYAGVLTIHAAFDDEEIENLPDAFGFLSPRPSRMRTLGWGFSSKIFPNRAPEGMCALSGWIGGSKDAAALGAPEDAVRHIVLGELSLALKMKRIPEPRFFEIVRHEPGLPQHGLGHDRRMSAVKTLLADHPDLQIVGNYVGGLSLDDCVKTAREAAKALLEREPRNGEGSTR